MSSLSSKIITICSSASFYEKLSEIEKHLKILGYKVKIPLSARKMQKTGNYNLEGKKPWLEDPGLFYKKKDLMDAHFKKVRECDAILVMNLDKKDIKGYIGGNVLMEMTVAYQLKKPVFIWRIVSQDNPFYEEILGIGPQFLNEDLNNLKNFKF